MARVFLAEDAELEREVVIKVLAPHLMDETLIQRFRNEVLQTARLQHPTIVSLLHVGAIETGDGRKIPFYVMPYVRGESLRSRLQHEGSLSVGATVRVLRSVLDALEYAHSHGVVHRDLKPENIFLSGATAVLADFGVAKAVAGPQWSATLTSPGTTVGTPAYIAPEQLAGDADADHRGDLYSVGIIAYEMLAGRLPWSGGTPSEMLASQARGAIVPLQSLRPDVPAELAAVIEKCLAWDVAKRPASAVDVLRVVETVSFIQTTPSSVVTRAPAQPFWRPKRARILAAAVLVLAGAALVATWALGAGRRERGTKAGADRGALSGAQRPDSRRQHGERADLSPARGQPTSGAGASAGRRDLGAGPARPGTQTGADRGLAARGFRARAAGGARDQRSTAAAG